MANEITLKELQDASLDAKSLEEVVNGNDEKQVTTRLGETYPSVKKAIKTLFENGGIASRFKTLTELQSSSLVDGSYALVADDTDDKNGIYIKEGGAWVKSKYDLANIAKNYTDSSVTPIKRTVYDNGNLESTHEFADVDGEVLARITKDGGLHLTSLDDSVQNSLNEHSTNLNNIIRENRVHIHDYKSKAHALTDADDNILLEVLDDGSVNLVGLDKDVVSVIKDLQERPAGTATDKQQDTSLALLRDYKDTFNQAGQSLLNNLFYGQTGVKAPPPLDFFPQNFTMSKAWIKDINPISYSTSQRITIDTPYHKDGGVVHPHVLEFYNGFRGYRYIACITPYQLGNEAEENPCIYGSNNLIDFDLLDGFTQPLDERPAPKFSTGHNSDNVLTYDPRTGELICIWRQSLRNPEGDGVRTDSLWMRKTKDGYSWTEKERIFISTKNTESSAAGCPAILYDAKSGYWYMYLTTLSTANNAMRLFKAKELNEDSWEFVSILTLPFAPWHQEVRFVGDKIAMLVYVYPPNDAFYFGLSDNFTDFEWTGNIYSEANGYKASFLPEFDKDNNVALNILYTTNLDNTDASEKWRMYLAKTNFINANVTLI